MAFNIDTFVKEYELVYEKFGAGNGSIRLAIASGEPPFAHSQDYVSISRHPLLCPLDSGEWTLVTSSKGVTNFPATNGAAAVTRAKQILGANE